LSKIIIYDADRIIRMLYEMELSELGYDVICSEDVSRCLEMITEAEPDVVVIDRKIGTIDGIDWFSIIRKHFPSLPLILAAAYHLDGSNRQEEIVDFYASKTADLADLKAKISEALNLRR